jgi:hypothetical protein
MDLCTVVHISISSRVLDTEQYGRVLRRSATKCFSSVTTFVTWIPNSAKINSVFLQ